MKLTVDNNNLESITKALAQRNRTEGITQQIRFKQRYSKSKPKLRQNSAHASLELHSWEFQEIN
ncbi:MAG: hypothetical protein AAI946_00505 [Candidatus Hodgkinia cicadicola]